MTSIMVIAEVSANHNGCKRRALDIIAAAADAGATHCKIQSYTPETISAPGTPQRRVYADAYTPREWHDDLFAAIRSRGMVAVGTPYSLQDLEFLRQYELSVLKISSFDVVNTPLISACADTRAHLLISTGMASWEELFVAEGICRLGRGGYRSSDEQTWLHCTSGYPASPSEARIGLMVELADDGRRMVGISDHTTNTDVIKAAVAAGAVAVEAHLDLSDRAGYDAAFSLVPRELAFAVDEIRATQSILGNAQTRSLARSEVPHYKSRPSLWVNRPLAVGSVLSREDLSVVRPSDGLPPRWLERCVGRRLSADVDAWTPLTMELLA